MFLEKKERMQTGGELMVLNKKPLRRITKKSDKVLTGKSKRFDLMSTDLSKAKLDVPTKGITNNNVNPKKGNAFLRGL